MRDTAYYAEKQRGIANAQRRRRNQPLLRKEAMPNPYKDLQVRHEYGADNGFDEIARYFPSDGPGGWVRVPHPGGADYIHGWDQPKAHTHHIWAGTSGNGRWDRLWNLISVSGYTHDFCHHYKSDGVVLCLTRKLEKGEFDLSKADANLGFSVYGWVENHPCQWPFAEKLREMLIKDRIERSRA